MMSFACVLLGSEPSSQTLVVSGTRSQTLVEIIAAARSELPMPVPNVFIAPNIVEWLSAPMTRLPGVQRPDSIIS